MHIYAAQDHVLHLPHPGCESSSTLSVSYRSCQTIRISSHNAAMRYHSMQCFSLLLSISCSLDLTIPILLSFFPLKTQVRTYSLMCEYITCWLLLILSDSINPVFCAHSCTGLSSWKALTNMMQVVHRHRHTHIRAHTKRRTQARKEGCNLIRVVIR